MHLHGNTVSNLEMKLVTPLLYCLEALKTLQWDIISLIKAMKDHASSVIEFL